jgi:hypothetical protein
VFLATGVPRLDGCEVTEVTAADEPARPGANGRSSEKQGMAVLGHQSLFSALSDGEGRHGCPFVRWGATGQRSPSIGDRGSTGGPASAIAGNVSLQSE